MTVPNALIIGPMKAGTTWIQGYLEQRGDVCLPSGVKETFFFDRHGAADVSWYESHFRHFDAGQHSAVVEVAPSLFPGADVPERVSRVLGPSPRLVATVRDPVERSWSHYLHLRRYGYTREPIAEAIAEFPQIIEASRYEWQLDRWRNALPEAQIAVLKLETLRDDPRKYAEELAAALGIQPRDPSALEMNPANEAAVAPSFVAAAIGRKFSYWLRDRRLYGVVNAAKAFGLKKLFYGRKAEDRESLQPTEDERKVLVSYFSEAASEPA